MQRVLLWLLLIAVAGFGLWRHFTRPNLEVDDAAAVPSETLPSEEGPTLGRFPQSQFFLEHDRFLPATDPRTVPAEQADWLHEDDEVFGVVVRGQARAYPIPMIAYHHVVNDVIRGIPVAITY